MSTPPRGGSRGHGGDDVVTRLVLAGGAAIAGAAATVWATGQLAALLASRAWPDVAAADMLGVLTGLPDHLGDPGQAWPEPAAAAMPGPVGMYATVAGVVLALLGLAAVAGMGYARLRERRDRRPGKDGQPTAARWATRRQLKRLLVCSPTEGRLTLGRLPGPHLGRDLVAAERGQSVMVVGPTRSGKTTGVAIPAILEWPGPALVASVKGDLVRDTLACREQRGQVWVYDPTQVTGVPPATWSPLAACHTWEGARRTAWAMTSAAEAGSTGMGGASAASFWHAKAAKLLAPALYAASTSGRSISDVVRWIDKEEYDEVAAALAKTSHADAAAAWEATARKEPKHRSSIYSTAEEVLDAYADPSVAASARGCDLDLDRLLDGDAHTLYLSAPADDQARLRPLYVALIQWILREVRRHAHSPTGVVDPPLLVLLDEAANIAPLHDLDTVATTSAEQGMQLVTVWQDLAQLRARYGDRADTIKANHRGLLALPGSKDAGTLDQVSRLAGEADVTRESTTHNGDGQRSTTEAVEHRRLVPEHTMRTLADGQAVLVYGTLPPARLEQRPWHASRELRRRADGGKAAV